MDERAIQFRVGYMVLGSLLVVGTLVVLFGEMPQFVRRVIQPTYTVRAWFPEGRGLTEDGLVRRNGIVIGRVAEIQFASEAAGFPLPEAVGEDEYATGILVSAEIRDGVKLYQHDVCQIEADLLGKPTLNFRRPAASPATSQPLDTGTLLVGRLAPDPLDSLSAVTETLAKLGPTVDDASVSIANAGNSLDEAARKVSAMLDDETQMGIRSAIARVNESLATIQNLVGDEETQQEIRTAMKGLPDSLNQMRTTMEKAQARLDDVQAFTEKLGSPETLGRLDRTTANLERVMADLASFSDSLKNPQGSLGLLLKDRQLYDQLSGAAGRVDDLSRQLQPILDDVRVFTDKIARHPELLGASGVIQRSPGIK